MKSGFFITIIFLLFECKLLNDLISFIVQINTFKIVRSKSRALFLFNNPSVTLKLESTFQENSAHADGHTYIDIRDMTSIFSIIFYD